MPFWITFCMFGWFSYIALFFGFSCDFMEEIVANTETFVSGSSSTSSDVCIFLFFISYLRSDSSNHVVGCQCEFSFRMPMHSKRAMSRQTLQLNRQIRQGKNAHSSHFSLYALGEKIFTAKVILLFE